MRKTHERNKRYGWLVVFAVLSWLVVALIAVSVDPKQIRDFFIPGLYFPMAIMIGLATFLTLSILLLSAIRSARWTVGIMLLLFLRVAGLGNIINAFLILGIVVAVDLLVMWSSPHDIPDK